MQNGTVPMERIRVTPSKAAGALLLGNIHNSANQLVGTDPEVTAANTRNTSTRPLKAALPVKLKSRNNPNVQEGTSYTDISPDTLWNTMCAAVKKSEGHLPACCGLASRRYCSAQKQGGGQKGARQTREVCVCFHKNSRKINQKLNK